MRQWKVLSNGRLIGKVWAANYHEACAAAQDKFAWVLGMRVASEGE